MKKIQILITIAFLISIISSNVFAVQAATGIEQSGSVEQNAGIFKDSEKKEKFDKDPLKRLEEKKESIQKDYKEGKITKEKAEEMTEKIDKHMAKIKEFNSLSLPQKKEKLSEKFKSRTEQEVKAGKLTKEEGEKIISEFNKELENWDGKEFPKFMHHKCDKHKK